MVAVTPRGAGWRRATRLGVTLLPLSVWAVVVTLRPGDVPLARPGWWLLGGATVLMVAGSAALASRRFVSTPGALLAPVVAVAAVAPVTLAGMFSWAASIRSATSRTPCERCGWAWRSAVPWSAPRR